ncbi:MAG: sensor histidine kinase, partial [Burkholderiales bacterium]
AALALQAQLAERARTDEARAAAFQELERGIERTGRLVQQLLDLARLEPGGRADELTTVDVAKLAREVVGTFAARAEALGVDLGADAPDAARIAGSPAELGSLIANLTDNALRYAPRESAVTVAVRHDGAAVELAVVDGGPGIPPSDREHVFQRFQRVAGDPTHGSGLGLAIAKAIAERHRGTLSLEESQPGAESPGLTVRVRLRALLLVGALAFAGMPAAPAGAAYDWPRRPGAPCVGAEARGAAGAARPRRVSDAIATGLRAPINGSRGRASAGPVRGSRSRSLRSPE